MSNRTVEQVKALITADLSVVEKAQLIEWLGAGLGQELMADTPLQQRVAGVDEYKGMHRNGTNDFAKTDEAVQPREIPWEEQPWTAEELRELMRPDPKSGAEIAAMIESGEVDTSVWAAMDIPDVVEWVQELRRRERIERGLEENG
ncbi:MAG: hypothetical protein DYG89_45505 [Caldilinea sp. CFX5]|nr:hypothetical protein [Caldilinea sp. CFX5]